MTIVQSIKSFSLIVENEMSIVYSTRFYTGVGAPQDFPLPARVPPPPPPTEIVTSDGSDL